MVFHNSLELGNILGLGQQSARRFLTALYDTLVNYVGRRTNRQDDCKDDDLRLVLIEEDFQRWRCLRNLAQRAAGIY